jgi:hypothetical protein
LAVSSSVDLQCLGRAKAGRCGDDVLNLDARTLQRDVVVVVERVFGRLSD